jgi:DNA-binding beta-propeller fold protein YncE
MNRPLATALCALLLTAESGAGARKPRNANPLTPAQEVVRLEGGRRVDFIGAFSSEADLKGPPSFWRRAFDLIAGPPEYHHLVRPYGIATDSFGRILITDPGDRSVHIFDFAKRKYSHYDHGKHGEEFCSPMGIAVDGQDNFYVTDSVLGKIFVFNSKGSFRRFIGASGPNEGFFKRPTGIAIDKQHNEIFVSDTLRDKVFVMDLAGHILRDFGSRGSGPGEFNFPTEVLLHGDDVLVVDAMNFRVQVFDRQGHYRSQFGSEGSQSGSIYRPKGLGMDSEGSIYLVDGLFETVQVFDRAGLLLYYFGQTGTGNAEFQLPSGLWIDGDDRIYVADSYNHRVQMLHFVSAQRTGSGRPE